MNQIHLSEQASDWMKVLVTHCNKSFPKIRIRTKVVKMSAASQLFNERNKLIKDQNIDSNKIKMVTEEIIDILTEEGKFEAYRFKKIL